MMMHGEIADENSAGSRTLENLVDLDPCGVAEGPGGGVGLWSSSPEGRPPGKCDLGLVHHWPCCKPSTAPL